MKEWTEAELIELAKTEPNPDDLKDDDVVFHPEIRTWRGDLKPDLQMLRSLARGQIQEVIFRKLPTGKIELVAGFRRYFHLKLLERTWDEIKKEVREDVPNREALIIALSENLYREDLSPMGEAKAIVAILKSTMTIRKVAQLLNRSDTWVRGRKALFELPEKVRDFFEEKKIDFGYSVPLRKLNGMEAAQMRLLRTIAERGYGGIKTIEDAEERVQQVLAEVKRKEELVVKYGPCPKCGSNDVDDERFWNKEKLTCGSCEHEWHKETKEPWEYYQLKQQANELGLELDLEAPGGAKLTPKEVMAVMEKQEEEAEKKKEEALPDKFRCKLPLLRLLEPMIAGDNIQKLVVEDDEIKIQLIEGAGLQFTGLRKDYKAGEKCRIEVSTYWETTLNEQVLKVRALIETQS